jgi:hypothetical protein
MTNPTLIWSQEAAVLSACNGDEKPADENAEKVACQAHLKRLYRVHESEDFLGIECRRFVTELIKEKKDY